MLGGTTSVALREVLVVLAFAAAACASAAEPAPVSGTGTDEGSRAIAVVKARTLAEPETFRSVWGSPLDFEHARANKATIYDEPHAVYWVTVPETEPRGLPVGMDVEVDLATGKCTPMMME